MLQGYASILVKDKVNFLSLKHHMTYFKQYFTCKVYYDNNITLTYYYAFQLQNKNLVFSCMQLYFIKRNMFSVVAFCLLILLILYHDLQVSTPFQSLMYSLSPPRGSWLKDS